jgi:hypothetical protein
MKKLAIFLPLIIVLFASCRKNEPIPLKVAYKVYESSAAAPLYTITYTTDKSGSSTISSSSNSFWTSSDYELNPGQFVSMKVDCSDPTFDITFRIYVNGYLFREGKMQSPDNSETISGRLSE